MDTHSQIVENLLRALVLIGGWLVDAAGLAAAVSLDTVDTVSFQQSSPPFFLHLVFIALFVRTDGAVFSVLVVTATKTNP